LHLFFWNRTCWAQSNRETGLDTSITGWAEQSRAAGTYRKASLLVIPKASQQTMLCGHAFVGKKKDKNLKRDSFNGEPWTMELLETAPRCDLFRICKICQWFQVKRDLPVEKICLKDQTRTKGRCRDKAATSSGFVDLGLSMRS
jgi:hypothetical protein